MGKRMVAAARFLFLCALGLTLILLVPDNAFAAASITVSPSSGPAGQTVIVTGTGWTQDYIFGGTVDIWIDPLALQVATARPDANGNFSVSFAIPSSTPQGALRIEALSSTLSTYTIFTVTAGQGQLPPEIVHVETFREGVLVFFRAFFTDPNNDAEGFGFRWFPGEETHPFSDPSFGRVYPGVIEYPFNLGCGTGSEIEFDVEVWIYNSAGLISPSVTVHLACSASSKQAEISYIALGDSIASGHGLDDNKETDPCRRSLRGYPHKVVDFLAKRYEKVDWTVIACSGATVIPLNTEPRHKWLHYQVDDALARIDSLPSNLYLVSITIGANDFEWAGWNLIQHLYLDDDNVYRVWVDGIVASIEPIISLEVGRLLERPNVTVIVTEVYNPFNKESVFFKLLNSKCSVGNILGDLSSCYERTRYAIAKLNGIFSTIYNGYWGQTGRLQITALEGLFGGHEAPRSNQNSEKCGDASPDIVNTWIQYRGDPKSYSYPDIPDIPGWEGSGDWRGDCFHPNETGAQEIARAVNEDALRLGR